MSNMGITFNNKPNYMRALDYFDKLIWSGELIKEQLLTIKDIKSIKMKPFQIWFMQFGQHRINIYFILSQMELYIQIPN